MRDVGVSGWPVEAPSVLPCAAIVSEGDSVYLLLGESWELGPTCAVPMAPGEARQLAGHLTRAADALARSRRQRR